MSRRDVPARALAGGMPRAAITRNYALAGAVADAAARPLHRAIAVAAGITTLRARFHASLKWKAVFTTVESQDQVIQRKRRAPAPLMLTPDSGPSTWRQRAQFVNNFVARELRRFLAGLSNGYQSENVKTSARDARSL